MKKRGDTMFKETMWYGILKDEMEKEYFTLLDEFVKNEYQERVIFPKYHQIYRAFELTDYEEVKVVILGQDPYHGFNQAEGLSFSVSAGVKIPPSLNNMYKELVDDVGCALPASGSLIKWAKEGVLLLNTVLTVPEKTPNGHKGKGWETFTDAVIASLNARSKPVVFILWGAPSQKKKKLITNDWHCIIEAPHPSPLSSYRGFFGSKPYSKTNEFLNKTGQKPIDWCKVSSGELPIQLEFGMD
jgi:uracil-DNA glycosylase